MVHGPSASSGRENEMPFNRTLGPSTHPSTHASTLPMSFSNPASLDRRRESIVANSSLRSHPFLTMGNKNSKVFQEDDDDSGTSCVPRRMPVRGAVMTSPAPAEAKPSLSQERRPRHSLDQQTPAAARPPARSHQRIVSESVATPPRRGFGLVRKLSFRARETKPTIAGHRSTDPIDDPPDRSPEVLAKTGGAASQTSGLLRSASNATMPSRPRRSSMLPTLQDTISEVSETQSLREGHPNPKVTFDKTHVPPSVAPSPERTEGVAPRASVPRSPPRPIIKGKPGSPGRHTPTKSALSRRAEREWKASLATLTIGPPKSPSPELRGTGTGPRPPPRRVAKLSGDADGQRGMVTSSSLSRLPQTTPMSVKMARTKRSYDTLSRMAERESPASGELSLPLPHSAHSSQSRSSRLTGFPSPALVLEQESSSSRTHRPLPAIPGQPLVPPRRPHEPHDSISSKNSYAPTFGYPSPHTSLATTFSPPRSVDTTLSPLPPPKTPLSESWNADDRIILTHASVPDLSRTGTPLPRPPSPLRAGSAEAIRGESSGHSATATPPPPPSCEAGPSRLPMQTGGSDWAPSQHIIDPSTFGPVRKPSEEAMKTKQHNHTGAGSLHPMVGVPITSQLHRLHDLTPGLERGGVRPRKTGLPQDDLRKWLQEASG